MQFSAAKRQGRTYGKGNRSAQVHNLYDQQISNENTYHLEGSSSLRAPISNPHHDSLHESSPLRHESTKSALLQSPPSNGPDEPSSSELKRSLIQDASLFDIHSSDQDSSADTSGSRASKRRRTTKQSKDTTSRLKKNLQSVVAESKINKTAPKGPKKSQHQEASESDRSVPPNTKSQSSSLKTTLKNVKQPSQPQRIRKVQLKALPLPQTTSSTNQPPIPTPIQDTLATRESTTKVSSEPLKSANHTTALSRITPKQKRLSPVGTDSELSSPGQLGFTGLKLGSRKSSPATQSADSSDEGSIYRIRRRRLIDRLDAPTKGPERTSVEAPSDASRKLAGKKPQKPGKTCSKTVQDGSKEGQLQRSVAASEDSESSQPRTSWKAKPRTTYAAQRSHLSDMMDDLDALKAPSSQQSIDELLLQGPTLASASQLELEDEENDEQIGAVKLKSIHELRQAGANNRFDREIDALFEDITLADASAKNVRLQGLVKLITKLQEPNFLRHLANSGRAQRLTAIANRSTDLPTCILLLTALSSLAEAEGVSVDILRHIFQAATDVAPNMLLDERLLSKIAKDRKQNLSKIMIHDLVEFEKSVDIWNDSGRLFQLRADMVAIHCLERALRKMVQLGDTSARLPSSLYTQVLQVLGRQVQHLRDNDIDPTCIALLETVLALLEFCSVVTEDADLQVGEDEYELFGNNLADIIRKHSNISGESLERSVLRVVVSVSNNKPRMCRLLGNTDINKVTFDIIVDNFPRLAKQAEDNEEMDDKKLDSVVLALGCLLNFAECDSTLRARLAEMRPGTENYIKQLVSIFNSQVSKVDEVCSTLRTIASLLTDKRQQPRIKAKFLSLSGTSPCSCARSH